MQQNLNEVKCVDPNHQNRPAVSIAQKSLTNPLESVVISNKNGYSDVHRIDQLPQFSKDQQIQYLSQLGESFNRLREAQALSQKQQQTQFQINEDRLASISGEQLNSIIAKTIEINSIKSQILEKLADLTNLYNNSMQEEQLTQTHSFNSLNDSEVQLLNSGLEKDSQKDSQCSNTTVYNGQLYTPTVAGQENNPSSNLSQQDQNQGVSDMSQNTKKNFNDILKLNVQSVLVVERPFIQKNQFEQMQQGIILLTEMGQGAYALHLGPNQGNNNFILNQEPNYLQSAWKIKESYLIEEPVTVEYFFIAGGRKRNQIYNPQSNNSSHAQTRIIEYMRQKKIVQQQKIDQ